MKLITFVIILVLFVSSLGGHTEIDRFRVRPTFGPIGARMSYPLYNKAQLLEVTVGYEMREWLKQKDLMVWFYKTLGIVEIPIPTKDLRQILPDLKLRGLTFQLRYSF